MSGTVPLNTTSTSATTTAYPPTHQDQPPPPYEDAAMTNIQPSTQQPTPNGEGSGPEATALLLPISGSSPPQPPLPSSKLREPPDNTVSLKDGTVIVIKNQDEIL